MDYEWIIIMGISWEFIDLNLAAIWGMISLTNHDSQ